MKLLFTVQHWRIRVR